METGAPKPRLVFWEVTKGCNLRCIHCRATPTELCSPLDLATSQAARLIEQIARYAQPILVLSGGEPLFRRDLLDLARFASDQGLRVVLATNGTLVSKEVALRIVDSGVRRVSISLDGADAATHDSFRGVPGAFDAALRGFRSLKQLGMPLQINTTIARHNVRQLPAILELAKTIGAEAFHAFLLVPVGCGIGIAPTEMVPAEECEEILNWCWDRSQEGQIEIKVTCAPHYFRVMRQRLAAERRGLGRAACPEGPGSRSPGTTTARTEVTALASSSVALHRNARFATDALHAVTKGCLAGSAVCFVSHQGKVYPCGYLPVLAGDLRRQSFAEVWETSRVFHLLRDANNLKGKCGRCEFRKICFGCRARAYARTGDFLDEEPFCIYEPRPAGLESRKPTAEEVPIQ